MKFGVFHLVWASPPLGDEALPELAARAREAGAELLAIATSADPPPFSPRTARAALAAEAIEASLVTSIGAERDIGSADRAVRAAGVAFLRRYVEFAAELGSRTLAGPLFGPVWQPTLLSAEEHASRWSACVESLSELAPFAAQAGVRLAVEPLSRFHTSFLNTAADCRRLVDAVGHPAVGIVLDTFQMNIEEKDLGAAIRVAGPRLFQLHACENDRGTPGSGHVDWPIVRDALRDVGFDDDIIIEAFNPEIAGLANFMKAWRRLEVDQDTLARDGLTFLKALLR